MPCWSGKPGACPRRLSLEEEGRFQSSPLPEYLDATTESRAVDVSFDLERAKELSLVESDEASRKTSVPSGWQSDRLVTARAYIRERASISPYLLSRCQPAQNAP